MNDSRIHEFNYDQFQLDSIRLIEAGESLIVSAPTGAGKTAIAEYAIVKAVNAGSGVVYTAPIKALSNQKYRDFCERFGKDKVGILTGDVVINAHAPLLVMTTEIFRNRLFDTHNDWSWFSWVIFDEVHYMDDLERGTVWEESFIFFPDNLKFLALSATIPNVDDMAAWLSKIHQKPVHVIKEHKRPVPLKFQFLYDAKILPDYKALKREGYHRKKKRESQSDAIMTLLEYLKGNNFFPCLYFSFSRIRCEKLARECGHYDLVTREERMAIVDHYNELVALFNLENDPHIREMRSFVERGIAFHHAGILPTLKEIIERMFTAKLLKMVFTTETFALGINMPARVVVFDELRKFYGSDFDFLKTRDFFQMAGRAGRRGFDDHGLVISQVSPRHIPLHCIGNIIFGESEEVKSQFNSNYATLLHMYQTLGSKLLDIYPRSFHFFQSGKKLKKYALSLMKRKIALLEKMGYLNESGLTSRGEFGKKIFGYELLCTELFMQGVFENYEPWEINVLITAMLFEPRKNKIPPRLKREVYKLKRLSDDLGRDVNQIEAFFQIEPLTKKFYFHLSEAMRQWMTGVSLGDLQEFTDVDEGEIIRTFRMTLQILRELKVVEGLSEAYYERIGECIRRLKRDEIDPELQFVTG